jgi:hypothetical protein
LKNRWFEEADCDSVGCEAMEDAGWAASRGFSIWTIATWN